MTQQPSQYEQQQMVRAVYMYAAEQMKAGISDAGIIRQLEERGLDNQSARTVVEQLSAARYEALRKAAQRDMMVGGLFCIGGILITAISYSSAASSPTGGSYVVTWGAIIFGAIQFFRGWSRSQQY